MVLVVVRSLVYASISFRRFRNYFFCDLHGGKNQFHSFNLKLKFSFIESEKTRFFAGSKWEMAHYDPYIISATFWIWKCCDGMFGIFSPRLEAVRICFGNFVFFIHLILVLDTRIAKVVTSYRTD